MPKPIKILNPEDFMPEAIDLAIHFWSYERPTVTPFHLLQIDKLEQMKKMLEK